MPSEEELQATVQAALTLVGGEAATLQQRPSSTIVPAQRKSDTAGVRALELIDRLGGLRGEGSKTDEALELHGTIGEGGMGVVRLGLQTALGREVAVKTLRAEHKDPHATLKLLREAWVTGRLEHPNVVPVYDIALDADGSPLIVLKKIEGDEWGELMHDPAAIRKRFGAEDPLEWNLRTLMQVCQAVRFAHDRGVLHRDLKPENVMIGAFGEVYLVDWGIAVSLRADGMSWLPLASDAKEMAGTPLYMAPEMLGGPTSKLSERTDVYLIGAILFEIVSSQPPHEGETLMELISSIVLSEPELPDDVPVELARIVRRAMDPDPDARFENIEQVRLSVQGFLQHRDARRLADRAELRLDDLRTLLVEADPESDDVEARERIYRTFGECRFGFRHALEVWPHNDEVRSSLDRAIAAMIEHELGQGEPEAARVLLGEMSDVPEELSERIAEARRERAAEDAELRRVSADNDPLAGRRTRAFISILVGVLWVLVPFGNWLAFVFDLKDEHDATDITIFSGAFLVLMIALGVWARESMTRTSINRQVALAAFLAMSVQLVNGLVGVFTGADPLAALHGSMLTFSVITFMLAGAIDWRIAPAAVGYLVGFAIMPAIGMDKLWLVLAIGNLILLINVGWLWFRTEDLDKAREIVHRRRAERRQRISERLGRGG